MCHLSLCPGIPKVADLREFGAMYSQDGEEEAQQNDLLQRKRPPPGQTKAAKYNDALPTVMHSP